MSDLNRRRAAAEKYRPRRVRVLLVAEGPPKACDRYFFFEDVQRFDFLFRAVAKAVLGGAGRREDKPRKLTELRRRGFFLVDLSEEPVSNRRTLSALVPGLVERARVLKAECIILIKANVYDTCFATLREAGLPVIDVRIPFPAAGRQREFESAFARALEVCP